MDDDGFQFAGFSSPNYTQVPDEVFDQLLPVLKEAEIKVLLYIIRRTFGFKKTSDDISFNQFLKGITTKDGRQLDQGCGVKSSSTLNAALKSLESKRIIVSRKLVDHKGSMKTTTYFLRFRDQEAMRNPQHPTATNAVPLLREPQHPTAESEVTLLRPPQQQETVEQETVEQERGRSNHSNGHEFVMSREDAERIAWVVRDIAKEFADQAPAQSTATRACRLYVQSGKELDDFLDAMQAARLRTKQYTGSIKTERLANGTKPKTAYFFGVLEDLIGVKRN